MNTYEMYVSLEPAKLLRQAGFDWGVRSFYQEPLPASHLEKIFREESEDKRRERHDVMQSDTDWNHLQSTDRIFYSVPTLAVAQRWLREVKGISVEVCHVIVWVEGGTLGIKWCYRICYLNSNESDILSSDEFDTFEAALEAGLQECLTLLIEKQC